MSQTNKRNVIKKSKDNTGEIVVLDAVRTQDADTSVCPKKLCTLCEGLELLIHNTRVNASLVAQKWYCNTEEADYLVGQLQVHAEDLVQAYKPIWKIAAALWRTSSNHMSAE